MQNILLKLRIKGKINVRAIGRLIAYKQSINKTNLISEGSYVSLPT